MILESAHKSIRNVFELDHRFILVWIKFSEPSYLRISFSNLGNFCSDISNMRWLLIISGWCGNRITFECLCFAFSGQPKFPNLSHIWDSLDRISQIWHGLNWVCPVWRIQNLGLSKSRLNCSIKVLIDFDKNLLFLKMKTLQWNRLERFFKI